MAKLNKEKFSNMGEHKSSRTTFNGDIELYLYYDTASDYFYFDRAEIAKYIPGYGEKCSIEFNRCKTRKQAVDIFSGFLKESLDVTAVRVLKVEIGVNEEFEKKASLTDNKLLMNIISRNIHADSASGFSVSFLRVMRYGEEGNYFYCSCNDNWQPNLAHYYSRRNDELYINWTPELEQFLNKMQHEIDKMCDRMIDFFNTDGLSGLLDKINQSPLKLIGPASVSEVEG